MSTTLNPADFQMVDFEAMSRAFKMPKISIGDIVLFYPDSQRNNQPMHGFVIEVWPSVISIRDWTGVDHVSVHHVDDPGLKINSEWRITGSWEHTETHQRYQAIEEAVLLLAQGKTQEALQLLDPSLELTIEPEPEKEDKKTARKKKKKVVANLNFANQIYRDVTSLDDLRKFCGEKLKEAGADSRGLHTAGRDTVLTKLSTLGCPQPPEDICHAPVEPEDDGPMGDGDPIPMTNDTH